MEKGLQKIFEQYIQECRSIRRLRPETIRGYRSVFLAFTNIMPEILEVNDLTREALVEFFRRLNDRTRVYGKGLVKTGVKDSTVRTYWSKLYSFFEWINNVHGISNPFAGMVKPPTPIYDDVRALNKDELDKIIAAVVSHNTNALILKRDVFMINLFCLCGLRFGEFISLQLKDVDIDKQLLTVRAETSKSKKERRLKINKKLMFHLKEYMEERNKRKYKTPYLIVSSIQDKGLSREGLRHWVKRYIELSGVKFHVHRFRHTFATMLEENNVCASKIQKLMGHQDIKMTMVYLRSTKAEDFGDELEKLSI